MGRVYNGTISGHKARVYPSHVYRTVKVRPLTLHDFDPDRVHYDRMYPRWTPPVSDIGGGDIEEHIDYTVTIKDNPSTFTSTVTLIIHATQHTPAKEDAVAYQFEVNEIGFVGDRELVEQILYYAFD